jgi:hypothetical protein
LSESDGEGVKTIKDSVLALLGNGPQRFTSMVGHIVRTDGNGYNAVSRKIHELVVSGEIVRLGRGLYALPSVVPTAAPPADVDVATPSTAKDALADYNRSLRELSAKQARLAAIRQELPVLEREEYALQQRVEDARLQYEAAMMQRGSDVA